MKLCLRHTKKFLATGLIFILSGQISEAALLGTDLSIETVFQQNPSSAVSTIGFLTTAKVVEPGVEFSSLAATEVINPVFGLQVVDVAINAGDDFIEIDFDNVTGVGFSPAFLNGYIFTFDSNAGVNITGATIDPLLTTLGLDQFDLMFSSNQLTVNVEGLLFNSDTFARIDLTSTVVPVPASVWLFGSGVFGLFSLKRKRVA